MSVWRESHQASMTANPVGPSRAEVVQERVDRGAYFTHEIPGHHLMSAVRFKSFAPSELAAQRTGSTPSHDAGRIQSGAFYTRQVIADPSGGQVRATSTWSQGQVGADKPFAVVFGPEMLTAGPAVARTIDGGNSSSQPVPQRSNPNKALRDRLRETERLGRLPQRNAEVAVSGEVPIQHVRAVVVKGSQADANRLAAAVDSRIDNAATVEEVQAAAHLVGRITVAPSTETRQQTVKKIHEGTQPNSTTSRYRTARNGISWTI